jgi:Matrixin
LKLDPILITLMIACFAVIISSPSYGQPAQQGFLLFKQNRFSQATPLLKQASLQSPTDKSLMYYYGVSAARSHDLDAAVLALSKVIVGTEPTDTYHISASQYLATIKASVHPYTCKRKGRTYRWTSQSQPLKVYVANGQQLPTQYAGRELNPAEYRAVANSFKNPNFIGSLPVNKLYTADDRRDVLNGLRQWDWATREKLFSFTQTNTTADADIAIFFADSFANMPRRGGYCQYPYEDREPEIIQIMMADKATDAPDAWPKGVENRTAHEFGHALGLEHSPDKSDIMYPETEFGRDESGKLLGRIGDASENDKATLRALYNMEPDGWLKSVSTGR